VNALERVVNSTAPQEILNAAIIQHFEFCFELAWKTLRHFAIEQAREVRGPRDAFAAGVLQGIIQDDEVWRSILVDRNLTVHTYNEALADSITGRIKAQYLAAFKELASKV
jgi:nucleotidyltransferase substrate binding protein (TIGR01987 family)